MRILWNNPERNNMDKIVLECTRRCPCPAARNEGGNYICTKEEGACEYQTLEICEDLTD